MAGRGAKSTKQRGETSVCSTLPPLFAKHQQRHTSAERVPSWASIVQTSSFLLPNSTPRGTEQTLSNTTKGWAPSAFPELEKLPKQGLAGLGDPRENNLRRLWRWVHGHKHLKGKHQRDILAQLTLPWEFLVQAHICWEKSSSNQPCWGGRMDQQISWLSFHFHFLQFLWKVPLCK